MKIISSDTTQVDKYVIPIIWFGLIACVAIAPYFFFDKNDPVHAVFLFCIAALSYLRMRRTNLDLVDEVQDGGYFILVKNRNSEERIPFSNIINVSASLNSQTPRIVLFLAKPCKFGVKIAFKPKLESSLNQNTFVDDLIIRVDKARANALSNSFNQPK